MINPSFWLHDQIILIIQYGEAITLINLHFFHSLMNFNFVGWRILPVRAFGLPFIASSFKFIVIFLLISPEAFNFVIYIILTFIGLTSFFFSLVHTSIYNLDSEFNFRPDKQQLDFPFFLAEPLNALACVMTLIVLCPIASLSLFAYLTPSCLPSFIF